MEVLYVTGNQGKFKVAETLLKDFGVELAQKPLDITEIQAETIEEIASDKAQKAFDKMKQPLFVSDSGWMIPSLNGFPGPYMKYINDWFEPEDFLNLVRGKLSREIILLQVIVYIDSSQTKTFTADSPGTILERITGKGGRPSDRIVTLSKSGKSVAEEIESSPEGFSFEGEQKLWQDFGKWLKEHI